MATTSDVRLLQIALRAVGVIFLAGLYPLALVWPSGWAWTPPQPELYQMILAIYATLGVFLLMAASDPLRHASLIWFTVWSSVAHAGVMAWHSLREASERGHLAGDVPALLIVAGVLALLMQRTRRTAPAAA